MSYRLAPRCCPSGTTPSQTLTVRLGWTSGWPALSISPGSRSHDEVPGPNALLRVAIVPDTGWAVTFLINDGDREIELKGFLAL